MWKLAIATLSIVQAQSIRGIDPSKVELYKDFKCFDRSNPMPVVNDDYCDCLDGSDEPGTSACGNATFYCENKGYRPAMVPSRKVNDGVCDLECCDGSDEWENGNCPNVCSEMAAKEALAEREREELRQRVP
jgi:protein kinase C substrate 80K-H